MASFLYYVGLFVILSLALYFFAFVLQKTLDLKVSSILSTNAMPALKPIPIPTKNQKSLLRKILVSIFEVRRWELIDNWLYQLDGHRIVIPKGFRFDGASIPRPFWAFLSPVGLLLIPGLIHDYAYKYDLLWEIDINGCPQRYKEGAGKEYWDGIFKRVGDDVNGHMLINLISWFALLCGGRGAWDEHRKNSLKPNQPIIAT